MTFISVISDNLSPLLCLWMWIKKLGGLHHNLDAQNKVKNLEVYFSCFICFFYDLVLVSSSIFYSRVLLRGGGSICFSQNLLNKEDSKSFASSESLVKTKESSVSKFNSLSILSKASLAVCLFE